MTFTGCGLSLYAGGVIEVCDICGDVVRWLEWEQFPLFGTHVLTYTASECMCSFTLVRVTISVLEEA